MSWQKILKMNPSLVVVQIGKENYILADIEEMNGLYAVNKMFIE